MRITEHELAKRKKRIIDTAYELFCTQGIDATSLLQIAKESSVSLDSLYHYFASKATLVQHTQTVLWKRILEYTLANCSERIAAAQSGLEEVEILLYNFKGFYADHKPYLLFYCEYKTYMYRNHLLLPQDNYRELITPIYKVFTKALARGYADGSISKAQSMQAQFFATWGVLRCYVEQMATYDKINSGENPWEQQFDLVLRNTISILINTKQS